MARRPYRVFRRGPILVNSIATATATSQTLAFTVPAGLSNTAVAVILVGWMEVTLNLTTLTLTFGGASLITPEQTILAANVNGSSSYPALGLYLRRNPPAGAQNLVLGGYPDIRGLFAAIGFYEGVPFGSPAGWNAQRDSTNVTRLACNVGGTAPPFARRGGTALELALAKGIGFGPSTVDGRFVELFDGIMTNGTSASTHCAAAVHEGQAMGNCPNLAATTTWTTATRLGSLLVQVPSV